MNIHPPWLGSNHYQNEVDLYSNINGYLARDSFRDFRLTIHPDMLWNPFVDRITRELQHFAEAYEAGERPKMAFCTPPQHGKEIADKIRILSGRGWITHGDLRVGDTVFHPTLAQGIRRVYKIRRCLPLGQVILGTT